MQNLRGILKKSRRKSVVFTEQIKAFKTRSRLIRHQPAAPEAMGPQTQPKLTLSLKLKAISQV